jgi:hypothetical protein
MKSAAARLIEDAITEPAVMAVKATLNKIRAEAAEVAKMKRFTSAISAASAGILSNARCRPTSAVSYLVTLNLFQGPWPAVSFGATLTERFGHGC